MAKGLSAVNALLLKKCRSLGHGRLVVLASIFIEILYNASNGDPSWQ
jgi:hypothetical protein